MTILAELVAVVAGTVLFYSGSVKLGAPSAIRSTLSGLGFPPRLTGTVAVLLGLSELLVGVAATTIRGYMAAIGLAALGLGFAFAGLRSLIKRESIPCNCIGRRGGKMALGWRQIVYLPLWLGVGALMFVPAAETGTQFARSGVGFCLAALVAFSLSFGEMLPGYRTTRSLRLRLIPLL